MLINPSLLRARVAGRKALSLGEGSRLLWSARVLNMGDSDERIRTGRHCVIRGELMIFAHGGDIGIGDSCYIGEGSRLWSGVSISIGDHVLISHGVQIMDNLTHPRDYMARRAHFESIRSSGHPAHISLDDAPVIVEDDVWIGAHAIVLKGVRIGARAIVGAGAVVTTDVPADTTAVGNPARLIPNREQAADPARGAYR